MSSVRRVTQLALAVAILATMTVTTPTPAHAFCLGEHEQSSGVEPVSPTCEAVEEQKAIEGFVAAQLNRSRPGAALTGWTDLLMSARWWSERFDAADPGAGDPKLARHIGHHRGVGELVGSHAIASSREADVVAGARAVLSAWWADSADRAVWTGGAWDHLGVGVQISGNTVRVVAHFRDAVGVPPSNWRSYPIDGGHAPWGSNDISQFSDVADDHVFVRPIERMRQRGVTRGCNDARTRFCPDAAVSRGQMAAFLTRALELPAGDATFVDVPANHMFRAPIAAMADAGVTKGCNQARTHFCPGDPVTRGQMAAFLVRALGLPSGSASFTDVPSDHPFRTQISALAEAGITYGCNAARTKFCPDEPVTRGQMSAFLARAGVLDVG